MMSFIYLDDIHNGHNNYQHKCKALYVYVVGGEFQK